MFRVWMRRLFLAFFGFAMAFLVLLIVEGWIAFHGPRISYSPPNRAALHFGDTGPALTYVVMGDSTAAGQGTSRYENGIAWITAHHLAQSHRVTTVNLAVSGAITADALHSQLKEAIRLKPDVILIALGANDATHFTSSRKLRHEVDLLIRSLINARCATRIVLTGSPDLGGARCFAQPLRWFAGTQAVRVNGIYSDISRKYQLTWAPIAEKTGPLFRRDRSLLAADRFHPNDRGYATWIPILDSALDQALIQQSNHCRRS